MTMNIQNLIDTLHPLERKVLPVLAELSSFAEIVSAVKLKDVEVMRALQWMQNKGVIKLSEEVKEVAELDENGALYFKKGLPEKRFLEAIKSKALNLTQIEKKTGLNRTEISVCMGVLKQKAAIEIAKDQEVVISITDNGKKLIGKESLEEQFLHKKFPVEIKELKEEERLAFENLRKRKDILKTKILKLKTVELTDIGKRILKKGIRADAIDRLTPSMLKTGSWKGKRFRRFDVQINVPSISGGKKQHYRRFLDSVRQKFMSLGFIEMDGPIVETDFWDMDALYMPQFHSARDIHQAYYIKDPEFGVIDEKLMQNVKKAHENGFDTGSKGWGYEFDMQRTRRQLLRTQGTACSARKLASKDLQIPAKYFGITRCFRYDVIDATHLPGFNQVEGIVVEEGLNIRHLFGLLQMFAKEFADTDQIKLVPAYFPFTEPSVALYAKHPEMGWIELGGAGIFRPELTKPLGVNVPVIAWGIGVDRLAMFKLGIKDIRELFSHDLEFLRKVKVI